MDKSASLMRDLARRLLVSTQAATGPNSNAALQVTEKLRASLTRFAGAAGFASLLGRALVLARGDAPVLHAVKVGADGQLEGFEQIVADMNTAEMAAESLVAHLLGLLVTFIGEPFTLTLVREAWPNTSLDAGHSSTEAH
jgi:hypothetical protein